MEPQRTDEHDVGSTAAIGARPRVLLVDDTRDGRVALHAALESGDYEIVEASSGEEALHMLLDETYAVILMDVSMPGMDGFETARMIRARKRTRTIPIIFVTAVMAEAEQVTRGYDEGAVDYMVKPVDVHALRAKIAIFVELFVQRQLLARALEAVNAAERRERRLAEALYDVTFEEAPIGIGHVQADGKWLRVNERLAELLGLSRDELLERPLLDLVHPDDRAAFEEHVAAVTAGVAARHKDQYRLVHADGSVVWTALTCTLLRDVDGAPVHLAIIEDISQERRLGLELEASERRFRRLCDSGLIGVFHEERDGTITSANDAFLEMVGYPQSELLNGSLKLSLFEGEPHDEKENVARETLHRKGWCPPFEREFVRRDGRTGVMLTGAVANGGAIGFALDVTPIREAELARARTLRELEEGVRARDDFLAIVSHELRTPLTPLLMQIGSLRDGAHRRGEHAFEGPWLEQQLATLERYARRVESLVVSLIEVSELRLGRLPLEREEIDLADLARRTVMRVHSELDLAGCHVEVSAEEPVFGQWDPVRLEQVAQHLLANAMKFGRGSPIELSVTRRGDEAVLSIRDHGPGIARADQERIFRRFGRLAQVHHHGGFGLGLWTAREVVQAHGGRIEVESVPGLGAAFRVFLPTTPPVPVDAPSAVAHGSA